jgi:hypothetical protein
VETSKITFNEEFVEYRITKINHYVGKLIKLQRGGTVQKKISSLWAWDPVALCCICDGYANGDTGICLEHFKDFHTKMTY